MSKDFKNWIDVHDSHVARRDWGKVERCNECRKDVEVLPIPIYSCATCGVVSDDEVSGVDKGKSVEPGQIFVGFLPKGTKLSHNGSCSEGEDGIDVSGAKNSCSECGHIFPAESPDDDANYEEWYDKERKSISF